VILRVFKAVMLAGLQAAATPVFAEAPAHAAKGGVAGAPAPLAAPKEERVVVPDTEKVSRSEEHVARMKQILKQVLKMLEDARNEKVTQLKGLLRVSEQAQTSLQEAVSRHESDTSEHEFAKISIAKVKVEQLRAESEECIGQLAYVIDEKTTVEVEAPEGLPAVDVTNRAPPPPSPIPTRPPPASKY
jgi:hypothetical protein